MMTALLEPVKRGVTDKSKSALAAFARDFEAVVSRAEG